MIQTNQARPRRRSPRRWLRAVRAVVELVRDETDAVEKARDVVLALGDRASERSFQRFVRSPEGRRLLEERPILVAVLSDRDAIEKLAPDSFGRAYLRYLDENGFEPGYLVEARRRTHDRWVREEGMDPLDPVRAWFGDRTILGHDLCHVLTGYGTDGVGEAALLPFTLGQTPGSSGALLTLGAGLGVIARGMVPPSGAFHWLADLHRAWRRGRRADWLVSARWEELLPLPLDVVRSRLHVATLEQAHPHGAPHDSRAGVALRS